MIRISQRLICREINYSDGVFNKTLPKESELPNDIRKRVTTSLNSLNYVGNGEKIPKIVSLLRQLVQIQFFFSIHFLLQREACVSLNESDPDEELAKMSGVSYVRYKEIVRTRNKHVDHSTMGRLTLAVRIIRN